MRDNISPEEKLLRLIRGQKKQPKDEVKTVKPKLSRASFQKYFYFLNVNRIIYSLLVISCIYLLYVFTYPLFLSKVSSLPKVEQQNTIEENEPVARQIRPYEYYTQGIKDRKLFSSLSIQEPGKPSGAVVNPDLIKDLNLVGIVAGDNPQAVIEDKKAQKTYYVTKGQSIGEFKVEEIQEGKIILNYNGQKFELYL